VKNLLHQHSLRSVVETGARFLLDPRHKHQPTLVSAESADRARRLDFMRRAVDLAHELGSEAVSFWSGTAHDAAPREVLLERIIEGCRTLAAYAESRGVRLAFEPEP